MYSCITIGLNPSVPLPTWLAQHVLTGSIATTQDKIVMSFCYQEPVIKIRNFHRIPSTMITRQKWLRFQTKIAHWLESIPNERYHYHEFELHKSESFSREYGNPFYQIANQASELDQPSWNSKSTQGNEATTA